MTQPILMNLPAMTDQQRTAFYANYQLEHKSEVAGVLFAVFLGGFGAHQFYMRRPGLGVLYIFLGFIGIGWVLGWIEAFFMPGRVRRFNAELSAYLAAAVTGQAVAPGLNALPAPNTFCSACGAAATAGVHYCGRCGAAIAS
jgi:TM2 domain-containing membrane protein YozV